MVNEDLHSNHCDGIRRFNIEPNFVKFTPSQHVMFNPSQEMYVQDLSRVKINTFIEANKVFKPNYQEFMKPLFHQFHNVDNDNSDPLNFMIEAISTVFNP